MERLLKFFANLSFQSMLGKREDKLRDEGLSEDEIIETIDKERKKIERQAKLKGLVILRNLVILFVAILIITVSSLISDIDPLIGIAVLVLLTTLFLRNGFGNIENDPPNKGVVSIWGERIETLYLDEGIYFLPLQGLLFGVVHVNVERQPISPGTIRTRTPDKADVGIDPDMTVRPSSEYLVNYLNSGGLEGVKKQFFGEIGERLREWAEGGEEGPSNWQELYQSKTEAVSVLVKRIAGKRYLEKHHGKIPSKAQKVPTPIWLKFFSKYRERNSSWPNEKFFENEKEWAGKEGKWEKVWDIVDQVAEQHLNNTDEFDDNKATKELKSEVQKRRDLIRDLQSGKGTIMIEDLGVKLERLNISNVDVFGEVAKAAEQQARETAEKEAEEVENAHVQNLVSSWVNGEIKVKDENGKEKVVKGPKLSEEEALRAVQVERGKVERKVDEKMISFDGSVKDVAPFLPAIIKAIRGGNDE